VQERNDNGGLRSFETTERISNKFSSRLEHWNKFGEFISDFYLSDMTVPFPVEKIEIQKLSRSVSSCHRIGYRNN
jgi:hypothetical protein